MASKKNVSSSGSDNNANESHFCQRSLFPFGIKNFSGINEC